MYLRSNSLSNSTDKTESNGKNDSNRLRNTQSCVSNNTLSFNLTSKGFNFGHLNIQGICGKQMTKFLELKAILTAPENRSLQVFGISESKLKDHKMSRCFNVVGFQKPFRKDNMSNGGGGIIVYVRNGLNVKRRIDLETNDISCIWLEILPQKGKSFLIGNMYRPPNSKIEFNDRFENFIDTVSQEGKEFILLGDFNKNLLPDHVDIEWENFTTSLGLSQLICDPTRVTETSNTLIDHIYTNAVENISKAHVCQTTISDHYAIFGSRKLNNCIKTNTHQTITYRSFKNFDENAFKADLQEVPWETVERFDNIDEAVDVWNSMFLEIVNKHAPMKSHRIKRKYQPE
ncbi:MAG: endonuclease/exonuclease/phosphatase family protein [Candidatus Thiodiazotropha endolucinida]|nr:endonuclease/exonuclease/phosphatase family protein [Candidatus Thiodiazotropha endolucinida]